MVGKVQAKQEELIGTLEPRPWREAVEDALNAAEALHSETKPPVNKVEAWLRREKHLWNRGGVLEERAENAVKALKPGRLALLGKAALFGKADGDEQKRRDDAATERSAMKEKMEDLYMAKMKMGKKTPKGMMT